MNKYVFKSFYVLMLNFSMGIGFIRF